MITREELENVMMGITLFKYLDTHKPNGEDVDGFTKDILQYLSLLLAHYEYCVKRLCELKDKLNEHEVKGWYQKKRKKSTLRLLDEQIRSFKAEITDINGMMSNL